MRKIVFTFLTLLSLQSYSQVHTFQLNNGLKILVKEDHRAPVAVAMLWFKVGSSDEQGGKTGLAHALEHLMFKGTPTYPLGVFSKTLASIGGEENAFTSHDYTAYYEKIAANQLPIALKLEADRMQNLLLQPEEFNKEIQVIQEERRSRTDDNPQALTFERFLAAAHLSAPYHHPVIGWMDDLQKMNIEDVRQWYQQYYAPNNAILVVVGDVKPDDVYQLAQQYFGNLKARTIPITKLQSEPQGLGKKTIIVRAPAELPFFMMGYTVPTVKTAKESWEPYALELIGQILTGGESARLDKQLKRDDNLASGVETHYNLFAKYQTQFILYGSPNQAHTVAELQDALLAQLQLLQKDKVSENELKKAKTQIIAQKTYEKDSIFGQAMELGLLEATGAGWETAENYIRNINAITPEQIQQTAQRYFQEKTLTTAELIPEVKK